MPNPKPCLENLTRAGKGRPKKGLIRAHITLSPELLEKLAEIQGQQQWERNYLVEQGLRTLLQMESDFDLVDFELLVRSGPCLMPLHNRRC